MNSGLTLTDVHVPTETLYSENRKIIDPEANSYNFVQDPVPLKVSGAPERKSTSTQLHPDYGDRGERDLPVDPDRIYVDSGDFERLEGKTVRLKELYNVVLRGDAAFEGEEVLQSMPKIQWVSEPKVDTRIIMPDGGVAEGFSDQGVIDLDVGSVVQFIRFGFCRLDSWVGSEATFRYAHS